MKIILFSRLTHYKYLIFVILLVIVAESFAGSMSIAMLIPLVNAFVSNENDGLRTVMLPAILHEYFTEIDSAHVFVVFGIILLLKSVIGLFRQALEGYLLKKLRHEWTINLTKKFMLEPYSVVAAARSGHSLNIASREILRAANYVSAVLTLLSSGAYVVAISIAAALASWQLTLIAGLILIFLYAVVFRHVVAYSRENGGKTLQLTQDLMAQVSENLTNLKEIKILNIEHWRISAIAERSREVGKQEMRYAFIQALPISLSELLFSLVAIFFGLALLTGWNPNTDQFMALLPFFVVAVYKVVTSAASLASHRIKAINREASFSAVCDLSKIEQEDLNDGIMFCDLETNIKIENVTFNYPDGAGIFKGLHFNIKRGEIVFIKGKSGSGKSTLLDLLTRLRDPSRGAISVNNLNSRDFSLKGWRRMFGYVGQDPHLFYGTVFENIALDASVSNQDVINACRLAGISDFIENLPKGYESLISERGLNFSGGQRRRIALARVLVRRPKVVLLDETTSAFESSLEREILCSLRAVEGMTVIIVTHRIENFDLASQIIDLDILAAEGVA